jgi:DNA modification methylase
MVKRFANAKIENEKYAQTSNSGYMSRGFMGQSWDGGDIAFRVETWREVYRVLKPGAHLLAFGGTRTFHRMACAIEDAGFEIRDTIQWLYGSGFPKSHDVSKGIDRAAGAEREIVGQRKKLESYGPNEVYGDGPDHGGIQIITAPATEAARQWEGWGTALKPACEPIVLARKPLSERTVAANVLRWGCGALNIRACRVSAGDDGLFDSVAGSIGGSVHSHTGGHEKSNHGTEHPVSLVPRRDDHVYHPANAALNGPNDHEPLGFQDDCLPDPHSGGELSHRDEVHDRDASAQSGDADKSRDRSNAREHNPDYPSNSSTTRNIDAQQNQGRWPANVIHDGSDEVVAAFPETGISSGGGMKDLRNGKFFQGDTNPNITDACGFGDEGSAARFFYTAKADGDDRLGSKHPTVKPLDLMQYLVRLICQPNGLVLDPFAGTGTTGEAAFREGMRAVLIECEAEYLKDIERRIELLMAGPDERAFRSQKAKQSGKPQDSGPLFGGKSDWDEMWAQPFDRTDLL